MSGKHNDLYLKTGDNMEKYVRNLVHSAKSASYKLSAISSQDKDKALLMMAQYLLDNKIFILEENKKDIAYVQSQKMKKNFVDRLALNEKRLEEMSNSLREIAALATPLNRVIDGWQRPNGLYIKKVRVPIGVVMVIYEARPNVTSDCAGLLFKTSNVAILRGGRDALHSNIAIGKTLSNAVKDTGINFSPFFIVEDPAHEIVDLLLKENNYIDLVIPRGGEALIRSVVEKSHIPVIKHYKGVCHIYVDKEAETDKALKICLNAKVQRPAVCNAVETILINKKIAEKFLPQLKKEFDQYNVEMRGDSKTREIISGIKLANKKDWETEYNDLIVSLKVVDSIEEAIDHINTYGSHHTDSIITRDIVAANKFVNLVDSACCFVNISTRFSDGYQFGLGAEIGISTDKLHARGPMGLEDLTTYKYIVYGEGQVRE